VSGGPQRIYLRWPEIRERVIGILLLPTFHLCSRDFHHPMRQSLDRSCGTRTEGPVPHYSACSSDKFVTGHSLSTRTRSTDSPAAKNKESQPL
jgi:hypothetical protein